MEIIATAKRITSQNVSVKKIEDRFFTLASIAVIPVFTAETAFLIAESSDCTEKYE
jgi:hypothetical protein